VVEHCQFFKYFSDESVCPVKAQSYEGEGIEIEMPKLGGFVSWLASVSFEKCLHEQILANNQYSNNFGVITTH
ncbi:hypothetical protein AVEN_125983-1, partial [Araneus ventricosus]